MKILAIYGSPNKDGNTATIVNKILEGAAANDHEIDRVYLYDMNYADCLDCENANQIHKEKYCIHDDDFTNIILPKLLAADVLILSSPVYIGHITGKTKTFLDRWYTFVGENFKVRLVNKKKFITVVTSGAPAETFKGVSDYLEKWLSDYFFKLEKIAVIHSGNLGGKKAILSRKDILERAEKIGKGL